ncbi:VWA domain-containing protein [archaeon]|jgi:Ca-activated chloride channel homolog|nr:VWA domain-containing protein [archaeon]MBT7128180.1 VWA domain-containing protein [archaeon]
MELVFLYPKFLNLLFLVPFFIFVYFIGLIYSKKKAMMFSNFEAMERFYDIELFSKNFFALYVNLLILILLVLTLSGVGVQFVAETSDFSYVIVVDTSTSMSSNDFYPDRLEAAKNGAKKFVNLLPVGVEIGVVEFSGDARVLHNLDSNKIKINMAIDAIDYGEVQGTNIYNALLAGDKLFDDRQVKAAILISDGQLNVGNTPRILNYINRNRLVVNTIAVGSDEGGVTGFDTISEVDEDVLKSLAFNSGGEFFRIKDVEDFDLLFDTLLTKVSKEVTVDLSFYFLSGTILMFTLLWVLHNFRFKVFP